MNKLEIRDKKVSESLSDERIKISRQENEDEIKIKIFVEKNYKGSFEFCFFGESKNQFKRIYLDIAISENCELTFISCCSFKEYIPHTMITNVNIGKNSKIKVIEKNIFNKDINYKKVSKYVLEDYASLDKQLKFVKSPKFGTIQEYFLLKNNASLNTVVKMSNEKDNKIIIYEKCNLQGKDSRCILKSKGYSKDNSKTKLKMKIIGSGDNSFGHIECEEISLDKSVVETIPILEVKNPTSRLTHEASIGKIESEKLKLLMSKGLSEKEAVDLLLKKLIS
jgi:Fe-S cluster assembly scaffold protein SufB